jgi:hypothetical protein
VAYHAVLSFGTYGRVMCVVAVAPLHLLSLCCCHVWSLLLWSARALPAQRAVDALMQKVKTLDIEGKTVKVQLVSVGHHAMPTYLDSCWQLCFASHEVLSLATSRWLWFVKRTATELASVAGMAIAHEVGSCAPT